MIKKIFVCSRALAHEIPILLLKPYYEALTYNYSTGHDITHNSPDGIDAAIASALMSHYCIYNLGKKSKLGKFIEIHVPGKPWSEPWEQKVGSKGWMSVISVISY